MKKLLLVLFATISFVGFSQHSIDVRVISTTDDAEECIEDNVFVNIGDVKIDNTELEMIYDDNVLRLTHLKIGLLFRNIDIPKGAIITNAFIKFTCKQKSTDVVNLFIQGQNSDSPETFLNESWNISSRPLTASGVNWIPQGWYVVDESGAGQKTPDISSVIQEIVNRNGWENGNSMAFVITGTGKSRTAYAYDGESSKAALLHIEYSSVGVDDYNQEIKATINPNPANSIFNLTIPQNQSENIVFQLFNQLGETVANYSVLNIGNGVFQFDIRELKNGLYYLNIRSNASQKTIKVMVSHS